MNLSPILARLDLRQLQPREQNRYVNRLHKIADAIEGRFPHVNRPEQIRLKHAQYCRNVWLRNYSSSERTQAEYLRALAILVQALGRPESWLGSLGLNKAVDAGGRPTKVGVRRSKKFYR